MAPAWKAITYNFDDLVDEFGIRFNGGTYMFWNNTSIGNLETINHNYSILEIVPMATIHYGRCYTIQYSKKTRSLAFDNIVIKFRVTRLKMSKIAKKFKNRQTPYT